MSIPAHAQIGRITQNFGNRQVCRLLLRVWTPRNCSGMETTMRDTALYLSAAIMTILLTIALTFGLCLVLTFAWMGAGGDAHPGYLLLLAALLAVLAAYVYGECWWAAGLAPRHGKLLYCLIYALSWLTAIGYWLLLRSL